jgi:hypothetical protein
MSDIPNLTEAEVAKFRAAKSEAEWNRLCDEVKRSRGGNYPADWYAKIIMTGLIHEVRRNW